jgi:hypothetical protein
MPAIAATPAPKVAPDSVATISHRWLPWLRALWIFVALNSAVTFAWMVYFTYQFSRNLPERIAAGLSALQWTNEHYFWFHIAWMALGFVCYFSMGAFIFLLRPNDRMAWLASILLIAFGGEIAYPLATEFAALWGTAPTLFGVSYFVNNLFSWGLLGAFLALFPDGRCVPRWSRYVAIFGFCFSFGFGIFPSQFGAPEGWLFALVLAGGLVLFMGSLSAQIWRYRHYSTPPQKQQAKWLIYALALIVSLVFLVTTGIYLLLPPQQVAPATSVIADFIYFLANLTFILLPLSIGMAILRYRLWDIDVLIRKTLVYTVLTALLALIYFGGVVLVQQLTRSITASSDLAIVVSTLVIAALFFPLRRRVQNAIDRRFYRRKYDAAKTLAAFSATVRDEVELDRLTGELLNVVQETMQPASLSVWLKPADDQRQRTTIGGRSA